MTPGGAFGPGRAAIGEAWREQGSAPSPGQQPADQMQTDTPGSLPGSEAWGGTEPLRFLNSPEVMWGSWPPGRGFHVVALEGMPLPTSVSWAVNLSVLRGFPTLGIPTL